MINNTLPIDLTLAEEEVIDAFKQKRTINWDTMFANEVSDDESDDDGFGYFFTAEDNLDTSIDRRVAFRKAMAHFSQDFETLSKNCFMQKILPYIHTRASEQLAFEQERGRYKTKYLGLKKTVTLNDFIARPNLYFIAGTLDKFAMTTLAMMKIIWAELPKLCTNTTRLSPKSKEVLLELILQQDNAQNLFEHLWKFVIDSFDPESMLNGNVFQKDYDKLIDAIFETRKKITNRPTITLAHTATEEDSLDASLTLPALLEALAHSLNEDFIDQNEHWRRDGCLENKRKALDDKTALSDSWQKTAQGWFKRFKERKDNLQGKKHRMDFDLYESKFANIFSLLNRIYIAGLPATLYRIITTTIATNAEMLMMKNVFGPMFGVPKKHELKLLATTYVASTLITSDVFRAGGDHISSQITHWLNFKGFSIAKGLRPTFAHVLRYAQWALLAGPILASNKFIPSALLRALIAALLPMMESVLGYGTLTKIFMATSGTYPEQWRENGTWPCAQDWETFPILLLMAVTNNLITGLVLGTFTNPSKATELLVRLSGILITLAASYPAPRILGQAIKAGYRHVWRTTERAGNNMPHWLRAHLFIEGPELIAKLVTAVPAFLFAKGLQPLVTKSALAFINGHIPGVEPYSKWVKPPVILLHMLLTSLAYTEIQTWVHKLTNLTFPWQKHNTLLNPAASNNNIQAFINSVLAAISRIPAYMLLTPWFTGGVQWASMKLLGYDLDETIATALAKFLVLGVYELAQWAVNKVEFLFGLVVSLPTVVNMLVSMVVESVIKKGEGHLPSFLKKALDKLKLVKLDPARKREPYIAFKLLNARNETRKTLKALSKEQVVPDTQANNNDDADKGIAKITEQSSLLTQSVRTYSANLENEEDLTQTSTAAVQPNPQASSINSETSSHDNLTDEIAISRAPERRERGDNQSSNTVLFKLSQQLIQQGGTIKIQIVPTNNPPSSARSNIHIPGISWYQRSNIMIPNIADNNNGGGRLTLLNS